MTVEASDSDNSSGLLSRQDSYASFVVSVSESSPVGSEAAPCKEGEVGDDVEDGREALSANFLARERVIALGLVFDKAGDAITRLILALATVLDCVSLGDDFRFESKVVLLE